MSERLREEKENESPLCLGSRLSVEDGGLVYLSSQASGTWMKQRLSA